VEVLVEVEVRAYCSTEATTARAGLDEVEPGGELEGEVDPDDPPSAR
jgi:hypothetical protein